MRVLLAPDSFKETLSAPDACRALAEGVKAAAPDAETVALPLSDGGEGVLEVLLLACGGERVTVAAEDARGRAIEAPIGVLTGPDCGETVVVEAAHAVGLAQLAADERDPLTASSRGLGLLLKAALARAPQRILVGLGGSATVDGGLGMAAALGLVARDVDGAAVCDGSGRERLVGADLERVAALDWSACLAAFAGVELEVLCDVTTPLVDHRVRPGEERQGAARLYGPQKGASPADVERLAAGLEGLARAMGAAGRADAATLAGGGAAGGLGAALAVFCGAESVSGFPRVAELVGLADAIAGVDLVITGEGCLDAQTAEGKVVAGVAAAARAAGVRAVAVVGRSRLPYAAARELGLDGVTTCIGLAGDEGRAKRSAAHFVSIGATQLFTRPRL